MPSDQLDINPEIEVELDSEEQDAKLETISFMHDLLSMIAEMVGGHKRQLLGFDFSDEAAEACAMMAHEALIHHFF